MSKAAASGGGPTSGPIRWQYFLSVSTKQARDGSWRSEAVSLGPYGGRWFTDKHAKTKEDHLRYVQGVDRMLARWVLEDGSRFESGAVHGGRDDRRRRS